MECFIHRKDKDKERQQLKDTSIYNEENAFLLIKISFLYNMKINKPLRQKINQPLNKKIQTEIDCIFTLMRLAIKVFIMVTKV